MSGSVVREPGSAAPGRRPPADARAGRLGSALPRAREGLAAIFFPADAAPARAAVLAGFALIAVVVAAMRLGAQGMNTVWAEDGQVFYMGAQHASLPQLFFHTYRGYMHAVPRVIAATSWVSR